MIIPRLVILITACSLVACHNRSVPITRDDVVGNYAYVSMDPESRATDHDLNRLILQSDGNYDLVEGGTTKPVSEKKGIWWIPAVDPPEVLLDHAGYPIEIKGHEVRLLIDLDVAIWWFKRK